MTHPGARRVRRRGDRSGTGDIVCSRHLRRSQGGSVTAEAAVVLPLVAAFAMALIWMISVGVTQVRVVDAARDAARALSRGDAEAAAVQVARRTAPADADVAVSRTTDTVTVKVSATQLSPGWLLVPLPGITVTSSSTVQQEESVDGS